MGVMVLKTPGSRLFAHPFVQAQIKENIKALGHWPLWGESTCGFPSQRASNAEHVSIWWRHYYYDYFPLKSWTEASDAGNPRTDTSPKSSPQIGRDTDADAIVFWFIVYIFHSE